MERKYWACGRDRWGRRMGQEVGPFETRHEAVQAALRAAPRAAAISSGYGEGGAYFDIRSDRNDAPR